MSAFTASPAASRLFVISIVARLPLAMLTIGMLVHVESATGSFAAAGLASGVLAVAQGVGGPLLGRVVDRRGQTATLVASASVCGAALVAVATLGPAGCALFMWRYDETFVSNPANLQAFRDVGAKLATLPAKSCARP